MRVVHLFSNLHAENFHWLNSTNIALLPKKESAEAISDFRPISLIHAVAKIIVKMMSIRLFHHWNNNWRRRDPLIAGRRRHTQCLGFRRRFIQACMCCSRIR
jgi:hypothetical protein